MKHLLAVFFITISFTLTAQGDLKSSLKGKWMMVKVEQDGKEVTEQHNPANNRFFIFKDDNSFESGGDPYGKNTGKIVLDEGKSRLMIDSDQGPDDDSMWKVDIQDDVMIWTGIGSEWNQRFVITHKKVADD